MRLSTHIVELSGTVRASRYFLNTLQGYVEQATILMNRTYDLGLTYWDRTRGASIETADMLIEFYPGRAKDSIVMINHETGDRALISTDDPRATVGAIVEFVMEGRGRYLRQVSVR